MALLRYFEKKDSKKQILLPHPNGPLAKVLSPAIKVANLRVGAIMESAESSATTRKRGPFAKYTAEQKALIGKRATECGVAATVCYFIKQYPNLKENTVRDWRDLYKSELKKRISEQLNQVEVKSITITELPQKKVGHPLLLGDKLNKQVRDYIIFLRDNGSVVNTAIVMGSAVGLVSDEDANLLACNGGHLTITKLWAKSLQKCMGFVKRKAGTKAKVSIEDFQEQKEQFLIDI